MNDKLIVFGICALILFAVFISGCVEEKEDKKEEEEQNGNDVVPTVQFKLEARDKLNSTLGQSLSMVSHKAGDSVKWGDIRFLISNDGTTFYVITFDEEDPNLKVIMTKGANIGDDTLFEVGEVIFFKEGSGNWDALNDFYIKIGHTPAQATIFDWHIDVV